MNRRCCVWPMPISNVPGGLRSVHRCRVVLDLQPEGCAGGMHPAQRLQYQVTLMYSVADKLVKHKEEGIR